MRAFVAPWPATGLDRAAARSRLGADAYDRAWRAGEELGIEPAVAQATARE